MKPHSVLLAALASALTLAGCATYDDYDSRRAGDDVRYYPGPARASYPADRYEERSRYDALTLFSRPDFRGETMKFDRDGTSLDKMIANDGIASLVIREGRWELCTGAGFTGACRVYDPGRYSNLGRLEGAPVNSLRRVG